VELALEIVTGEVVGEIADHVVENISIASYRHHPSGLAKWQKRPNLVPPQALVGDDEGVAPDVVTASADAAVGPAGRAGLVDLAPTADDEALVAEYEASVFAESSLPDTHDVVAFEHPIGVVVPDADHIAPHSEPHHQFEQFEQFEQAGIPEPIVVLDPVVEPVAESFDPAPSASFDSTFDAVSAPPQPSFEPPFEPPFEPSFEPSSDSTYLDSIAVPVESSMPIDPSLPVQPVFELSVADILAELAAEMSSTSDRPQVSDQWGARSPFAPEVDPPAPATEPVWQIDDTVDWQVEATVTPAPVAPVEFATVEFAPDPTFGVPTSSDGPVVEFDLSHLLAQAASAAGTSSLDTPLVTPIENSIETAHAGAPASAADDEVRSAVRAALAEIEAAMRTDGDHEVPSILVQADLADLESPATDPPTVEHDRTPFATVPVASAEVWNSVSAPAPPVIARPVLPDRSTSAVPVAAASPASRASPASPAERASPDAVTADSTPSDPPSPSGPPSQEIPATGGGLRRLLGTRKP